MILTRMSPVFFDKFLRIIFNSRVHARLTPNERRANAEQTPNKRRTRSMPGIRSASANTQPGYQPAYPVPILYLT
jgi:hypothetical protein